MVEDKKLAGKIYDERMILKNLEATLKTTPDMEVKALVMQDMQAHGFKLQALLEQANGRGPQ